MDERRSALSDVLQAIGLLVALAVYIYAIGWFVTWVHLAAARLPVAASLPAIDDKVIFATGVSAVLVMAIAFAAMCAVAYAVHAGRWDKHVDAWSEIVNTSRSSARERFLQTRSPRPPRPPRTSRPAQEGLVRVIAGFNVGVLSVTLGLVGARFVKPLIDQWQPGHWWALLVPWALVSIVAAALLGSVNPLRGGRLVHTILWLFTGTVAMLCSAPLGLLLLTWMGIATFGRWYGKRPLPSSTFEFLRSPLPWLLLTVYALVGLAYSAMPPVSFSRTTVETTKGTRHGGYLARNASGMYLVSCTPLANATSIDNRVEFVPADAVKSVGTVAAQFTLDSGYRPSLPTLALHAFGVDATTPSWIRPELREKRSPCAGEPPPSPSTGSEASRLGSEVFAGPAPPNGRARDGEPPIEQTSPEIAELAKRFQPTVLVSDTDPFWPVSVGALLEDIGNKGQPTCLHRQGASGCVVAHPTLSSLSPQGSSPADYLEFPVTPALSHDPERQLEAFLRGQQGRNTPIPTLKERLADPGKLDPWSTAQVYFFYAGKANPARWPARNRTIGTGLVGLQYWFFYPYNYYPTFATPELMSQAPIAGDVFNTDLHQGDWEHMTVLVDPKTKQAQWLYMAHHSNEGEYLRWNSPLLSFDEGHPVVQAAYGGHPTYPAYCGPRRRYANGLDGLVSDWLVCGAGRFAFRASTTPLVDIAKTPWACWKGHFGVATPSEVQGSKQNEDSVQRALDDYYEVAGPRSPLWQAENGHLSADGENQPESGFCVGQGGPQAPEREAIGDGIGG